MDLTLVIVVILTALSTFIGGNIVIRYRSYLPYFFAFASGSLMAVTFFDILPESLEIARNEGIETRHIMLTVVISFFLYNVIEKYFLTHHHCDDDHPHIMGPVGAGGLILHSFLDGVAIGTAFQLDSKIGLIVAFAVISHDFTDGINTVSLMLKNKQTVGMARLFLIMGSLSPALGILLTGFVTLSESALAYILAVFAGEFIYIGAANLLPETHKHTPWKMILSMGSAIALIYALTSIIL